MCFLLRDLLSSFVVFLSFYIHYHESFLCVNVYLDEEETSISSIVLKDVIKTLTIEEMEVEEVNVYAPLVQSYHTHPLNINTIEYGSMISIIHSQ